MEVVSADGNKKTGSNRIPGLAVLVVYAFAYSTTERATTSLIAQRSSGVSAPSIPRVRRNVIVSPGLEHVMVEQHAPGLALVRGHFAQCQERVEQGEQRRVHIRRTGAPPEVDHRAECIQGLDVMHAQARHVQCVAGFEFGDLRMRDCLPELRKAVEIRLREIDQADRLARELVVDRSDVQIVDLLDRKQVIRRALLAQTPRGGNLHACSGG